MQNVVRVQVIQANANLNEETPDAVLSEVFVLLFVIARAQLSQMLVQVVMLAKLHDDVDAVLVRDERVMVANNIRRVHARHHLDLADGLVVCAQPTRINLLDRE